MSSQPEAKNPFKGLRPFKQNEELFGRERDLILMKDRILSSRTTLLFAGSGVGKTSFLNAKVIPALKDRYCVISHNRWTGSEEGKDQEKHPSFKIWPPKSFGRWFGDVLFDRVWRYFRLSKAEKTARKTTTKNGDAPQSLPEEEIARRKVEASVQSVIAQSLGADNKKRLSQELAIFKRQPQGEVQPKQCILILDQFEEVFQYHSYENYFKDFILDLAEVINNHNYQVRVVFSMREEFLGELSAFDNNVPDLFNNYYRLRHPEIDEARDIIEKTCLSVKVPLHEDNLDKLVKDLASIQKNFEITNQGGNGETRPVRVLRRDFVPPPYLQVVCDSLWKEQYENSATTVKTAANGGTKKEMRLFLENYKAGSENPVDGEESDAQRVVRVFCETKLSAPFLKRWEQRIAARAFGFLVTKQGAKMAYELRSLAAHMDKRVWALKHVLHKLSEPEARILRESRGPEGSYWFELYHDMYAGVVERWKRKFRREQSRRNALIVTAVVCAAVIGTLVGLYWIKAPYDYRQTLATYRDTLSDPDVEKDPGRFAEALVAYNQLESTYGYHNSARSLWAQIWQRRAQLYESKERRDQALMCLLQGAALVKGQAEESQYLAQGNNLFGGNEQSIQATFCTDCRVSGVSSDGKSMVTISTDGIVNLWDLQKRRYSSTICSACDQAIFSTDNKNIATVSPLKDLPNQSGERTGAASTPAGQQLGAIRDAARPIPAPTPTPTPTGWTITISSVDSGLPVQNFTVARQTTGNVRSDDSLQPRFILRSFVKTDGGFLIAGIVDNKLKVWRESGALFADIDVDSELRVPSTFLRADFNRDGRFLAAGGLTVATKVWEVTPTGLLPSRIRNLSGRRLYAFSSDGRYFLSATSQDQVGLWELRTQKEVLRVTSPPLSLGFGVGSGKFFVTQSNATVEVWDSGNRTQDFEPFKIPGGFSKVLLDASGKNIVIANDGVITKWSLEQRRLVGELQTRDRQIGGALTPEGSFLGLSDSSVRLWDISASPEQDTFGGEQEEQFSFGGLSSDGVSMLSVMEDFLEENPTSFHVWNISKKTKEEFSANAFLYAMSSNPVRVVVISRDDKTKVQIFSATGQLQGSVPLDAEITSISVDPRNSLLAVVTNKNEVQLIDIGKAQIRRTIKSDLKKDVASVVFAPNSEYLLIKATPPPVAAGGAHALGPAADVIDEGIPDIEVWSLSRFERIPLERDTSKTIAVVGFGGSRLFTIQNKRLEIWDLLNGKKLKDYPVEAVLDAAMSADGNLVAVGDANGILQVCDVRSAGNGSTIKLGGSIQKILFASDGRSLIAMTEFWFHNIPIASDKIRYSEGIFVTGAVLDSVRLSSTDAIHWIRQGRGGWGVRQASFDGQLSKSYLKGDPDVLLNDWSQRLGLQIQANGYLAPNSPLPTPPSLR